MAYQIVEVKGLREAQRALKQLPDFAKGEAQQAINTTAFTIARQASRRAPKRTGTLQGEIQWQARPRSVTAVVGVTPKAHYWKWVEYGTVKMNARPFLRPAAESEKTPHEQRLLRAMERAGEQVERAAGNAGRLL